jgi:hypothetical protein
VGKRIYFCSASERWYAFQPGHQPVCQRHSRAHHLVGLASARLRMGQFSHLYCFFVSIVVPPQSMNRSLISTIRGKSSGGAFNRRHAPRPRFLDHRYCFVQHIRKPDVIRFTFRGIALSPMVSFAASAVIHAPTNAQTPRRGVFYRTVTWLSPVVVIAISKRTSA